MSISLTQQVATALAAFSSSTRLYELHMGDGFGTEALLVEAFVATDALQVTGARDVIVLSTSAHIDIAGLLGHAAALAISLADGTRYYFHGDVAEVAMLGSDGGFARYRLRLRPWLWRLGQVRNSRVWQDRSVIEIVDEVLGAYLPLATWRWSDDAVAFMRDAVPRSYCCQYRESDLDFIRRLLAEEGLAWRFEDADGEEGSCAVFFADSSHPRAMPEDATSAQDGGIRFHRVGAVERQDAVQSLTLARRLHASLTTVLSVDYKARQVIAASSPSRVQTGGKIPYLESYDTDGQYAYANREQAQRHADLRMQAIEARAQVWHGRSSVRTLRAGTRITVTGVPVRQWGEAPVLMVSRVTSVGVNNLPPQAQQALSELFGPIPELLEEMAGAVSDELALVIAHARESGYANCFDAVPAEMPWRPERAGEGSAGAKPTARGAQSAIVIGADGNDSPNGADELYCDRLDRVRIRFHWQENTRASCWVRVAQRSAGGGMGAQFLPRIGQEVLVQFLENDIDRPIVVGALYNGQGEGGIAPTPGGRVRGDKGADVFASANDHVASGQGNLAGGNSPAWHGASGDNAGHRNAAAQWGLRSKELGGSGYNQLLFDDTDGQGRVQLKCTHGATELNLGHLIHAADNYRGSFRGVGVELRTDACGAVRAGAGLLVSSYRIQHGADARDAAGEAAGAAEMLAQAARLADSFSAAARTHQTVALASHSGAAKANASLLDDKAAPLKAMLTALSGLVGSNSVDAAFGDAAAKNTAGDGKLPHFADPLIAIAAKDGFGANAGQSLQLANGETVSLMSGQDTQFVTGGQIRVHSGQAIGVLGGAVKAGEGGVGLQVITAKDAVDIQAQADELKVQARDSVDVISANAHIDWAAAKRISLSTAGGANITIEGGNITVQCPGKIKVHAGKKSFSGPVSSNYPLPKMPSSEPVCIECMLKALRSGSPLAMVSS
ncbi:type VI secretion system tip protein VgrG [Massilia sp. Dwa41.01b]|uniref:type VI secretion system Vgr family protein n=1 Tax=Massilia sp. Dwa41.01b TaxID=2709302 RepID=UPI00160252E7|nr:type VI secretion system tip protein TssI/VgrG [Massilia sp. Dwa41.01b]QNA90181.1 type VI secretion system tip protein VgrG [Massilia sp. Dwa41.01b]